MKDVLRFFEIDVPEIKKGDSLKPKKPAKLNAPEPPKKQKEVPAAKKNEPKTEQKPTSSEKVENKKSEL